jgi:hypothetical protein
MLHEASNGAIIFNDESYNHAQVRDVQEYFGIRTCIAYCVYNLGRAVTVSVPA